MDARVVRAGRLRQRAGGRRSAAGQVFRTAPVNPAMKSVANAQARICRPQPVTVSAWPAAVVVGAP
jgi:hypothetical protein